MKRSCGIESGGRCESMTPRPDRLIALYRSNRPDGYSRRPRADHGVGQQPAAPVVVRHRGAQERPGPGVRLHVLLQMAIAREGRQAALDALHGGPVRVRSRRQHAVHERNRRGSRLCWPNECRRPGSRSREPGTRTMLDYPPGRHSTRRSEARWCSTPSAGPSTTRTARSAGRCRRRGHQPRAGRREPCAPIDTAASLPDQTGTSTAGTARAPGAGRRARCASRASQLPMNRSNAR